MAKGNTDLSMLSGEWEYHLRAKNLSPATIRSYLESLRLFDNFVTANGVTTLADIDKRDVEKFLIQQHEQVSAGTVLTRFRCLRVFFNWCADEGELDKSPMLRMKEPRGDRKTIDVPSDDDVTRMFDAITGKTYNDVRDVALLRFMFDTGVRVGEVISLRVDCLDLEGYEALVVGKGRKERRVGFGLKTRRALRKYMQARRTHPYAESENVFLGQRAADLPRRLRHRPCAQRSDRHSPPPTPKPALVRERVAQFRTERDRPEVQRRMG